MKSVFVTIALLLSYSPVQSQQISWEHTNGPYGGVIYSMVDDGEGHIFAGTEGDGIFRSEDNGETWVETNNGLTNFLIYSLAVNQNGQVFAGTDGDGIFRLDVGGTTWTAVNNGLYTSGGQPAIVNSIAINDSGHVFAGLLFRGVYRSTDNGANWIAVDSSLSDPDILAIAINDSNEVFVSTLSDGVFKSTNNGATWMERGLSGERIYAFLLLPNEEIFAGRWRSTDNGENWFPTSQAGTTTFWSFLRMASGEVYATTSSGVFSYISPLWVRVGSGLPEMTTFTVIQRANGDVFTGSGGMGVYRLSGSGDWTRTTTGITNVDVRAMTHGSGNDVYAASYFSGIFRSTDNGATWTQTKVDVNVLRVECIIFTSPGTLLAGTWRINDVEAGKVFRSTDNGESWTKVLQPVNISAGIQTLTITPSGEIFAGTIGDSLYKSTDDGVTWFGVTTNNLTGVTFFSLSSSAAGDLFAGTLTDGLMRSSDSGTNWASAQNGLPNEIPGSPFTPYVRSMVFNAAGAAFAGTNGGGAFWSLNNGDNWVSVNAGLTNLYVLSMSMNMQGDVFAGTENGVFRMINNSENWSRAVSGLGNTYVRLVLVTADGHVLAGTWGSGMFRTTSSTVTGVQQIAGEVPLQFSLEQNYPNPFNPKTNFGLRIAEFGLVTLKVFDLLGKEVATVLSEKLQPGTYTIPWDASALPSGVYFYRLQAGSFIGTKRAVLLK